MPKPAAGFTMAPDWVDHLSTAEIRSILEGWHDAIRYWSSQDQQQGLISVPASPEMTARYTALAKARVSMWEEVLRCRVCGEKAQHVVWRSQQQES